jgi:hypothetical protein
MPGNPNHQRSRAVRARLTAALLPRLQVGTVLPIPSRLAPALGCNRQAAWRHLRGAMAAAGVVLAVKRGRLCVSAMPEARGDG